jgi:hypothetical protein
VKQEFCNMADKKLFASIQPAGAKPLAVSAAELMSDKTYETLTGYQLFLIFLDSKQQLDLLSGARTIFLNALIARLARQ